MGEVGRARPGTARRGRISGVVRAFATQSARACSIGWHGKLPSSGGDASEAKQQIMQTSHLTLIPKHACSHCQTCTATAFEQGLKKRFGPSKPLNQFLVFNQARKKADVLPPC
jgi:hypothetical protein